MHYFRDAILLNLYGSSEVAADCTWYDTREGVPGTAVPLGRPIPNNRVYILDAKRQFVPPGMAGELFVGGVGVANGYLRRPDLTTDRFVADPFSGAVDAKMFRTGDRVRFSSEGLIEFLGRADHQVKIRGFRVELQEIEKVIVESSLASQCLVVAMEHAQRGTQIVAYVVTSNGVFSDKRVREVLLQKLPDYMVPSSFVRLEKMPLTPNGKIDRMALPKPEDRIVVELSVEPKNEHEKIVASIFGEVLGEYVASSDLDFFELGGHSLLATKVLTRIRERAHVEVSMQEFFRDSTVRGVAELLSRGQDMLTPKTPIQRRMSGRI